MVVGGEDAIDFAWEIHQSTQPAHRGEFSSWTDGDANFRVVNDAVQLGQFKCAFLVHASSHPEWGIPGVADVTIRLGAKANASLAEVRSDDFPRPFEAWKHAIKVALAARRSSASPAQALPAELVPFVLSMGERAIRQHPDHDPLAALTRASPGCRLAYSASYVDHQIRNGGFAQLFWNVVAANHRGIVASGSDALRTLDLVAAADLIDAALVRVTKQMDRLQRCLGLGMQGFAEFRDDSGLLELNAPYWQASRELPVKLDEFAHANPEYFARR